MAAAPRVKSIALLNSEESGGGTTGQLVSKTAASIDGLRQANPDDLGGGYRFFPDAVLDPTTHDLMLGPTNIIRIKLETFDKKPNQELYVRVYDIDDPSNTRHSSQFAGEGEWLDPNGGLGNDNIGTFADATMSAPGVPLENPSNSPNNNPQSETSGNFGGIRALDPITHLHDGSGWTPGNQVITVKTDADGIAYLDFATTFAPGDNFQIAATFKRSDLTDNLFTSYLDRRSSGNVPAGMIVSDTIAIWRKLYIEFDAMDSSTIVVDSYASAAVGQIARNNDGSFTGAFSMPAGANGGEGIANLLEGGFIRIDSAYFRIISNTPLLNGTTTVTFGKQIDPRTLNVGDFPTSQIVYVPFDPTGDLTGKTIALYEDDAALILKRVIDQASAPPQIVVVPRFLPDDPTHIKEYMKYARSTSNPELNRFADAFIQPDYLSLKDYSSALSSAAAKIPGYAREVDMPVDFDNPRLTPGARRTSDGYEFRESLAVAQQLPSLFWTTYVVSAYQRGADDDNDANNEADATLGHTVPIGRKVFLFGETARDVASEVQADRPLMINGVSDQLGQLLVHELGHVFVAAREHNGLINNGHHRRFKDDDRGGAAYPPNIMYPSVASVELSKYWFHPKDLKYFRTNRDVFGILPLPDEDLTLPDIVPPPPSP